MSNETNEAVKQSVTDCNHLGDAAKMRDALNETQSVIAKCMDILNSIPDGVEYDGLIDEVADELCDLRDSHVKPSLSAPPRNCDVGRPEEQAERFRKFCETHKPDEHQFTEHGELLCPSTGCELIACNYGRCALVWSQMPYEEGCAK